jgi:2-hydroxy-3-keto-5-methylthiopentenyl-1-phosphate phosphatase
LLSYCKQKSINCVAYEDFHVIRNVLEQKIAELNRPEVLKPVIAGVA